MASQASTKVRRVRCPRCWMVLEELPDVFLYRCGGCGNILQGKNRTLERVRVELSSQETNNVVESQEANVLEAKEIRSSNHVSTGRLSLESSPDKDCTSCRDGDRDSNVVLSSSNVEDKEPLKPDNLNSGFHDDNGESAASCLGKPESIEHVEQCYKGHSHENDKEGEKSQMMVTNDVLDLSDLDDPKTVLPSDSEPRVGNENSVKEQNGHAPQLVEQSIERAPKEGTRNFGKSSSMYALAHTDPMHELNMKHGSMANHYPYVSSESLYDGMHEQISARMPSRKHCRDIDDYRATDMFRQDTFRPPYRNLRKSSYHGAVRSGQWGRDKYAEITGYASENNLRRVGFSSNQRNLLPPRPRISSSSKASYSEVDKTELLRTIYELKDQLHRMQFANVMRNRMFMDEIFDPFRYDPNYPGQYWRPYTSSECSLSGHEMNCDNPRLDEVKRERRRVAKRYVRPVAGAAPIIACHHCSKLLQLPVDFLIFEKQYHRLMCNACKKVLKFSLVRGTCLVPYILDDDSIPPPSGAYGYSKCQLMQGGTTAPFLPSSDNDGSSIGSGVGSLSRMRNKWRKSKLEIKEVKPSSNNRLHHLMGYSSPSQVFD